MNENSYSRRCSILPSCSNMAQKIIQVRRRLANSGFTLVELLVTIGVIAVLIGLVVSAGAGARKLSQRTICLSNLRQVSQALVGYATENKGRMPPQPDWATANNTYHIRANPVPAAKQRPEVVNGWYGLGHIIRRDKAFDSRVLYCPSQEYELFSYPSGWTGYVDASPGWAGSRFQTAGYSYRLFGAPPTSSSYDTPRAMMNTVWIRSARAIVSDIAISWDYKADYQWPHRQPYGLNVGFADGSVQWLTEFDDSESERSRTAINGGAASSQKYFELLFDAFDRRDLSQLRSAFPP
jgi:prepilin-type N-terminal cleavage/methylation domain-containing protein/prepilin-type processing-associated H-X9-DG protein